jgi:hypothetical protein
MKAEARIAELHALSKVYAKAKAECDYLKHFRKSKLAILKIRYAKSNPKTSNAALDDLARASTEYIAVLEGLRVATEVSEAAFWELTISKSGIQIWQTKQADRRAEMNIR